MVDMEKFYDTVDPAELALDAVNAGMPARVLYLDLLVYLSPRTIQYLGASSEWVEPEVSLVAGSRNSNHWTRGLLYDVLDRAHALRPWVRTFQWVDDLNSLSAGTLQTLLLRLAPAAANLIADLIAKGLRISTKTAAVGPMAVVARAVASGINNRPRLAASVSSKWGPR